MKILLHHFLISCLFGLFLHLQGFAQVDTINGVPFETAIQEMPNEFVEYMQEPQPLNMKEISKLINYPSECSEADIEGKVMLRVLVDLEGVPVKHIVKRSPHQGLTDEAIRVLYLMRFKPAIRFGRNASCWTSIPFDFKLKGKRKKAKKENIKVE
jgi:TonB family protein